MRPSNFALTRSYFDKQIARTLEVVDRIRNRNPVLTGRVIPDDDSLAIHDARRITATVLFLDISNFSQRPSYTAEEQENVLAALSLFFTEMIRIVEDYGGRVEKNTGDGLMAYFIKEQGDNEPSQQKALAAALTMFHAGETIINPVLRQSDISPLGFVSA
jgi:adenylate cyclase